MRLETQLIELIASDYDNACLMLKQCMLRIVNEHGIGLDYRNQPEYDSVLTDCILWIESDSSDTAIRYDGFADDAIESPTKYLRKVFYRFLRNTQVAGARSWWNNSMIVRSVEMPNPYYTDALNVRGGVTQIDERSRIDYNAKQLDLNGIIELVYSSDLEQQQVSRCVELLGIVDVEKSALGRWNLTVSAKRKVAEKYNVSYRTIANDVYELQRLIATNSDVIEYAC